MAATSPLPAKGRSDSKVKPGNLDTQEGRDRRTAKAAGSGESFESLLAKARSNTSTVSDAPAREGVARKPPRQSARPMTASLVRKPVASTLAGLGLDAGKAASALAPGLAKEGEDGAHAAQVAQASGKPLRPAEAVDGKGVRIKGEGAVVEPPKAEAGREEAMSQALLAVASMAVQPKAVIHHAEIASKPVAPNAGEGLDVAAPSRKPAAEALADRVSVTDLRKTATRSRDGRTGHDASVAAAEGAGPGATSSQGQAPNVQDLDLDLGQAAGIGAAKGDGGGQEGKASAGAELAPARSFSTVLADQLGAGWNDSIVKSAHIVLRDGDSGLIRLRLHPESLGGVKIELRLADNGISGKIIVESDEAKTAFEKNMAALQDAFTQGGFESARLEVEVGSGGSGAGDGQANQADGPFWSTRRGLESLSNAVPDGGIQAAAGGSLSAVNLLA